jgi:hypothetical protein
MATGNLFDATASVLGYLYQCRYALLLLVQRSHLNPSIEISIERFDDVAFEEKGAPQELIQTKHHIGQPRNLTDASTDLWKTIRIWSEGVLQGTIDLKEASRVIVTTATAPNNSAASLLRLADRDEVRALQYLLTAATVSKSEENKTAIASFLRLNQEQKEALVKAIHIFDNAPDIIDVLPQIKKALGYCVPLSHMDRVMTTVEGWWLGEVIKQLMVQGVGKISGQALHTLLDDLREQFRRDTLPTDFCFVEPPDLADPALNQRTFVKQLRVVNSSEITISKAICDHYKCWGQRSHWVREDLLLLDEWDRYERKLIDEWERRFAWANEELEDSATDDAQRAAGRKLYHQVQEQTIHIRPDCTEPVIMRGSYHDLANGLKVGWHPCYAELLEEGEA